MGAGPIVGGVLGLGGQLGSAAIQANAARKAAGIQSGATEYAADIQKQIWDEQKGIYQKQYDQGRADWAPYQQTGVGALSELGSQDFRRDFTMSDFQKDPGYEFRMAEGQKALERSAAARGGLQSGGTLKALARYGQDYASGEFTNAYNRFNADRDRRFNRLSSLAGIGQNAASALSGLGQNYANQMGSGGQNYANQMGNLAMQGANAKASGVLGTGGAWGNAISNIGNMGMQAGMMGMGGGGGLPMGGQSLWSARGLA